MDASTAANTKAAYRSDWAPFTTWTTERGFAPLPAPALVVAHYVTEAAAEQTGVGKWRYTLATLSRWVSSINQFHTAAGLPPPGGSEVVRRALSGVRQIRAVPPVRRSPLLLDDLRVLMLHLSTRVTEWPAGVAARRDMALLLLGFDGAHRRAELVALTLADVTLHRTDGLHVRLRSSKTDQEAHGQVKPLPYGRDPVACPPCAFVRWRELLHAWDTAPSGSGRRAVMPVLRRQAATDTKRVLAPRTVRAYAGDWALFTDWCHATGSWDLPADPAHPRRLPRRLPVRAGDPAPKGRGHRPPTHRGPSPAAGAVGMDSSSGRRRPVVWAVRGRAVAPDPERCRDPA